MKETTESIIIAFVLAFVFRTFVIEAFVIPTGSMASTLYGKHGTLACEDCGWENAYGLTDSATRKPMYGPQSEVICQNCSHVNTNLDIHDGVGRNRRGNAESGDRILVFKWPLNIAPRWIGPQRWDVTVFKNPAEADENFIKRLLGLPNEVLEIIDGDVYAADVSALSQQTLDVLERRRSTKHKLRTGKSVTRHERREFRSALPDSVFHELADKLLICRKTPEAQQSLWHVVYNNDYPPMKRQRGQPYWEAQSAPQGAGWSVEPRTLVFRGGTGVVRFRGKRIADHNAYNINLRPSSWHAVDDLRLEAVVNYSGGEGSVDFVFPKNGDVFAGRLWADGRTEIIRSRDGGEPVVLCDTILAPLSADRPLEITFENVDYRIALYVNGREVLATSPEQYFPNVAELRRTQRAAHGVPFFRAMDVQLALTHVVLYRDAYYTSPTLDRSAVSSWARQGWGTSGNPILLREDEYFMLGDNSPASKDSRLWDITGSHLADRGDAFQLGTVPADQIVGRAFFVYWPSGLRPDWLPVLGDHGIIPNVGRMRWIR